MNFYRIVLLFCCYAFFSSQPIFCESSQTSQQGTILFQIRQGNHEQALKLYQELYQSKNGHDFELLHRIGLGLLDYGFRQNDPEIQLLTLFGANFSLHEDAYYILEESLKNKHPEIQLVALTALSLVQRDRADQALLGAMGSSHFLVRFEAVKHLCKKRHPRAVDQAECLMYKSPRAILSVYPPLFAYVGDSKSIKILRKMINDPSEKVRRAVILSASKYKRDDLLPQIRQQTTHFNYSQQEACAYAIGVLKDEESIDKLKNLANSQYTSVAIAANWALYKLGQETAIEPLEKMAMQEDLFAIAALGSLNDHPKVLLSLIKSQNLQVRVNAIAALFEQQNKEACNYITELLISDNRDLGFVSIDSPGKAFHAWKVVPSSSEILKDDIEAYQEHMEFKESILAKVRELSTPAFIKIASEILASQQRDLVPQTVDFLVEMETPEAVELLKLYQQKLGAPFIRNYCNLGLYRLGDKGPYAEQLIQWVRNQSKSDLIQFRPFSPWEPNQKIYELTPQETSQLLIGAFEAFTINQDRQGIEVLIEVMATGHPKNKYALAGVLLRATQ